MATSSEKVPRGSRLLPEGLMGVLLLLRPPACGDPEGDPSPSNAEPTAGGDIPSAPINAAAAAAADAYAAAADADAAAAVA
ncbi:hypothetical protein Emag_001093 [Eimeria magna]